MPVQRLETQVVTFVIPALNAERTIGKVLASVYSQKGPWVLEIIIIDDCSSDASVKIASELGCRVIRHRRNVGLAESLNEGIQASTGEIVCLLHQDCILTSAGWLQKCVTILESHHLIGAVTSKTVLPEEVWNAMSFWDKVMFYWERRESKLKQSGVREVEYLTGKHDCFKKSTLERLGELDSKTFRSWSEDVDLSIRLRKAGLRIMRMPVEVLHMHTPHKSGLRNHLKNAAHWGTAKGACFRKHRVLLPSGRLRLDNPVTRSIALALACVPLVPATVVGFGLIISNLVTGTLFAYREVPIAKTLTLYPFFRLALFLIDVFSFWVGFILKRQM